MNETLTIKTSSKTELVDITADIEKAVRSGTNSRGVCFIFVPHTTAAVTINERADPSVKSDIVMVLNKIVPWEEAYEHLEGNSPAHIKASMIGPTEFVALDKGQLKLGTWQGIFFCEFDGPRTRKVHIQTL